MFLKAAANPLYRTPFVAYTNAGVCARSAGRLEQAERYLRQALTFQVDYPETYAQLAGVLHERGSDLQARAFVERFLAVAPATPDMLLLGHNIEVALKDTGAAAGFRDRLRKEFPESEPGARGPGTGEPESRMSARPGPGSPGAQLAPGSRGARPLDRGSRGPAPAQRGPRAGDGRRPFRPARRAGLRARSPAQLRGPGRRC